jgi:hypothetical protein
LVRVILTWFRHIEHVDISLVYTTKLFLIYTRNLKEGLVTPLAVAIFGDNLLVGHDVDEFGTLALEKLAVLVVIDVVDFVVGHDVIVQKSRGSVDGETPPIGHTKSLRHLV